MNEYYIGEEKEVLFNSYANINTFDFTKLYYDILPIVRFEEVKRYTVVGFNIDN